MQIRKSSTPWAGNGAGGSGGPGDDFYHIKLDDLTEPSDENAFTALRVLKEILKPISALDDRFLT